MVKHAIKTGGASRIRFVMVEAEIADGDVGQITQAISNALRGPTTTTVQRIVSTNGPKTITQDTPELEAEVEHEEEVEVETAPRTPKQKTQRKAGPAPEVVPLDANKEPSLASYAQKANPKSHHKRFLVIAAWFKECRSTDAINVNHVYTCYRLLGWPTNISNFSQPLRELKFKQFFASPEKGSYAINHLGLQQVAKLKADEE